MYHTYLTILLPSILSFISTIIATRFFKGYFLESGIALEDHNKEKVKLLPSGMGIPYSLGILVGILAYVAGGSFIYKPVLEINDLFAASLSMLIIAVVGFIDDVNIRNAGKGLKDNLGRPKKGLKQWQKPLLTALGALPLMAINAGTGIVHVPFLGNFNLGLLYPLIIIPLGTIFFSNAINLLGGFDGLQTIPTSIACLGFLIYSLIYGNYYTLFLSGVVLAGTVGIMIFNIYPAKVIPGDSFTYAIGASFVSIMVLGNAEAIGIIFLFPWIIEFFLHLRKKFDVSDLGIRQADGTFKSPYGKKIYSLTHLVMNLKKANEKEITLYISLIELLFLVLGFSFKLTGIL
ncbi:MAG: hypothetical protein QXL16_00785 [Candidatus Micrarchaeaceae archaeon]